jgi:hypothetical protein
MCPHDSRALDERFDQFFEEADIIVDEYNINYKTDEMENYLNLVSKGTHPPNPFLIPSDFSEYHVKLQSKIYRSGKRIILERSPLGLMEVEQKKYLSELLDTNFLKIKARGFANIPKDFYDIFRKYLHTLSDHVRRRDKKMFQDLKNIRKENPDKNILVIRGPYHTGLWHDFIQEDFDVDVIFSKFQPENSKIYEIMIRYITDKSYEATDKEIRAMVEELGKIF